MDGIEGKRIAVVANPAAGRRRRRRLERFVSLLESAGGRVELFRTGEPGEAVGLVQGMDRPDLLVAAGGDGTLNEVVNGLYRRGEAFPVAFFPSGTANVFACEASLPTEGKRLVDLLARPVLRDYPLALADYSGPRGDPQERAFLLMAGVGWDAAVTMDVGRLRKSLLGRGAYVWSGARMLLSRDRRKVVVSVDGLEHKGEGIIVANSPFYAGPFSLTPSARPESPLLSVAVIRRFSAGTIGGLMAGAVRRREDTSGNVLYLDASRVEVVSEGDPIQMDGDPLGFSPAVFRMSGRSIPVVAGPLR